MAISAVLAALTSAPGLIGGAAALTGVGGYLAKSTADGTLAKGHALLDSAQEKADSLLANARALVQEAPQLLLDGTKLAGTKSFAKGLTHFIDGVAEQFSAELKAEGAGNGIFEILQVNTQLKEAIADEDITEAALRALITDLSEKIQSAEIHLHGYALNAHSIAGASSLDVLQAKLKKTPPQPELSLQDQTNAFSRELGKLSISIRRKAEITACFGESASLNLINSISNASESKYKEVFEREICNFVQSKNIFSPFRPLYRQYYRIVASITGLFVGHVMIKIDHKLCEKMEKLLGQDQTSVMNAIANILFEGLELYTNEVVNVGEELVHTHQGLEGTPQQMIAGRLAKKKTLHGGCEDQKQFYQKIVDYALMNTFSWKITRFFVNRMINSLGLLNSPFDSVPKSIRNANGFQYSIDKAIVGVVTPLIDDLKKSSQPAEERPRAAENAPRAYSHENKETLARAIKTLFTAIEINRSSNIAVMHQVVDAAKKQSQLLSSDTVINQTAEASALSALESLNHLITPRFILDRAIDSLKVANSSFSTSDPIPETEMAKTELQRKQALDSLTQVLIHKAVDDAPILNTDKIHEKMNAQLSIIQQRARELLESIQAIKASIDAGTPDADEAISTTLSAYIDGLRILKETTNQYASDNNLNDSQKDCLDSALNCIVEHLRITIDSLEKPAEERSTSLQACIDDLQSHIEGRIFAQKAHASIMNVGVVKKLSKLALTVLLQDKFNKAYGFACDPKTIKYLGLHHTFAQFLKP
jgi:hypothetical protein